MLHLICSNVREHQKGKFIVLVTERDIVGASCYLKMINKNSYWFCKVNKSSCSNDSISQWKGLVELVWHSADPPQAVQLSQTVGLSLSAGAFEPNTEWPVCAQKTRWCHHWPAGEGSGWAEWMSRQHGSSTATLWLPEQTTGGHVRTSRCKRNQILQSLFFFLGFVFSVVCMEIFLSPSGLSVGVLILGTALAGT